MISNFPTKGFVRHSGSDWPLPPGAPPTASLEPMTTWSWDGRGDPWASLHTFLESSAHDEVEGWGLLLGHGAAVAALSDPSALGRHAPLRLGQEAKTPSPAIPNLAATAYRSIDRQNDVSMPHAENWRPVGPWVESWTSSEHAAAVVAIREAIAAGEVYQVNVVGHRSAELGGIGQARHAAWRVVQLSGPMGGSLVGPRWSVHSASPELMLRKVGNRVWTEPIKGTTDRAPAQLQTSEKDRAEHVMIVDLERNDLARVASTGTVEVQTLYDLKEWAGLTHAHSLISAELDRDVSLTDLLRAVLPGGSVTGAPKSSAIRLLHELEPVGRGPAMGAMGWLSPSGDLTLGLTIRTIGCEHDAHRVHLWTGGGVTWSSTPQGEVAEAEAKAQPIINALGGH